MDCDLFCAQGSESLNSGQYTFTLADNVNNDINLDLDAGPRDVSSVRNASFSEGATLSSCPSAFNNTGHTEEPNSESSPNLNSILPNPNLSAQAQRSGRAIPWKLMKEDYYLAPTTVTFSDNCASSKILLEAVTKEREFILSNLTMISNTSATSGDANPCLSTNLSASVSDSESQQAQTVHKVLHYFFETGYTVGARGFINLMMEEINCHRERNSNIRIEKPEILRFIKALLLCCVFKSNATELSSNPYLKSKVKRSMENVLVNNLLRSLSRMSLRPSTSYIDAAHSWSHSNKLSSLLVEAYKTVSAVSTNLMFLEGVTLLSLDDDKLRKGCKYNTSRAGMKIGYHKSGMPGPTVDCTTSLAVGGVLTTRLATSLDGTKDRVEKLLMPLDSNRDSLGHQLRMTNTIASDRGYSQDYKDISSITEWLCSCGFVVIGTSKRGVYTPFTYGHSNSSGQVVVTPTGEQMLYVARHKTHKGLYFLAYRSGHGKVVLLKHSVLSLQEKQWVLRVSKRRAGEKNTSLLGNQPAIPNEPSCSSPLTITEGQMHINQPLPRIGLGEEELNERGVSEEEPLQSHQWREIFRGLKILTQRQSGFEWLMLRKFRFTSTVSHQLILHLKKSGLEAASQFVAELDDESEVQETQQRVLQVLRLLTKKYSISNTGRTTSTTPQEGLTQRASQLQTMLINELKSILRERGERLGGTKSVLIHRILSFEFPSEMRSTESEYASIESTTSPSLQSLTLRSRLMKMWFMTPLSADHLKTGLRNESKVLQQLPSFLFNNKNSAWKWSSGASTGLLVQKHDQYMAASPDFVVELVHKETSVLKVATVELKTATTCEREREEKHIAQKYGCVVEVCLEHDGTGSERERFLKLIPDESHRCQVFHQVAVLGSASAVYVVASTSEILRVVFVHFSRGQLASYCWLLKKLAVEYTEWAYSGDPNHVKEMIKKLEMERGFTYGHAVDRLTFYQTWSTWIALNQLRDESGDPIPPCKGFIPSAVHHWNLLKGGVDIYSKVLKSVQGSFQKLETDTFCWIRLLLTCVYNAWCIMRTINEDPANSNCYEEYQKKRSGNFMSFKRFLSVAITYLDKQLENTSMIVARKRRRSKAEITQLRLSSMNSLIHHFPETHSHVRAQRCSYCNKKVNSGVKQGKRTRNFCKGCETYVCPGVCWKVWHTKEVLPPLTQPISFSPSASSTTQESLAATSLCTIAQAGVRSSPTTAAAQRSSGRPIRSRRSQQRVSIPSIQGNDQTGVRPKRRRTK